MTGQGRGQARSGATAWAGAVAVVAAAPLLLILATGHTLAWRDTSRLFGPVRTLVVEALRDLRLPLWNPYEGLGMPLFAQSMHAVLHPVSLLAALLAPGGGMDPLIVANVVLAAVGTFLLARELGASPAAAALGGIAFGLSGYVVSMSSIIQYQTAAGVAPWTVAALHAAGRGRRFGVGGAGAAVAILAFAGDPQWLLVASVLGAGLAWSAGGGRGLGRAVLGIGLGATLAAVQLVPSWAYFREADRSAGLSGLDSTQWSLAPVRLLELALPGFFYGKPGESGAPVFVWLGGPCDYSMPFVPSVFLGVAVLWLATRGARGTAAGRFLGAASVALLWLALGPSLGATQLLRSVPVWGAFRYAEKMVGPLALCLAALAALGSDRVEPGRRPAMVAGVLAGLLVVVAATLAAWSGSEVLLRELGASQGAASEARWRLAIGAAHAAGAAALLGVSLAVASRPARRGWFPALAAAAVAVASMGAVAFSVHAGARIERDDSLMAAVRASERFPRISTPTPASWGPAALDHWDRLEWIEGRMGLPSRAVEARVANLDAYSGVLPIRYLLVAGIFTERFGPGALVAHRRLGLSHVVVGPTTDAEPVARARAGIEGGRLLLEDPVWRIGVWQVPHRPWAWFAPAAVSARDRLEAHLVLADLVAAERPAVVLEGHPEATFAPGRVLSAARGAEWVRLEAESSGPGLLVVNDLWFPGWRATLDGAPVTIHPADAAVRAVDWPAGRHVLEMRYDPPELQVGLWISACGALVLGVLLAAGRREPA